MRYPDLARTEGIDAADLTELARRIGDRTAPGLDFQRINDRVYSVADQFELLTLAVGEVAAGRDVRFPLKVSGLLGPDAAPPPPPATAQGNLDWLTFRDALAGVEEFVQAERSVPPRVFVGAEPVAPADFLVALASAWSFYAQHSQPPVAQGVALGRTATLLPFRYVANDTTGLFGGWVIHKAGFRAPKLVELARLQAWSLKPATRQAVIQPTPP
jgi:hypothetical protein